MKLYDKICKLISRYNYIVYALLILLSLGACFYSWFVYILVATIFLIGIFSNSTMILSLIFFLYPFESIFIFNISHRALFSTFTKLYLIGNLVLRHIIISIKEKSAPRKRILILFAIYVIFCICPPHVFGLKDLVLLLAELLLIYVVFQKKLKFDFIFITESLVISLLVSSVMGFLRPVSNRLTDIIPIFRAVGLDRYSGLMTQPNIYGMVIVVALSFLCILKYHEKINDFKFVLYNSLLIFFGIKSISRSFIIATLLAEIVFTVLYIIRYKKNSFKHLAFMYLGIFVAIACSYGILSSFIKRFRSDYNEDDYTNALDIFSDTIVDEKVMNGEIRYDPGRLEIWKLYLKDIFSSPIVFLFGRGISRVWIGQMATHNDFLQLFWINGLVGTIIYLVGILMFVNFKKINFKSIKENLYLLVFLLPLSFLLLIEHHPLGKLIFVVIMLLIDFGKECNNSIESTVEKIETKEEKGSEV